MKTTSGKPNIIGRVIFPYAKKKRNSMALRYIKKGILLDIGGGEGDLLNESPCNGTSIDCLKSFTKVKGIMKEGPGMRIVDKLRFKPNHFDYVTMIAVLEHMSHPAKIIREVYRILKRDGLLIITTPKAIANKIIPRYLKGWNPKEHKNSFDFRKINNLTGNGFKLIEYKTFELGINQLFILRKI